MEDFRRGPVHHLAVHHFPDTIDRDGPRAEFRPSAEDAAGGDQGRRLPWSMAPCGRAGPGRASASYGPGNTRPRATDHSIITNLAGRITFASEPVPGNQHDMAKLKGSDNETILRRAGGVIGDKGFIGS